MFRRTNLKEKIACGAVYCRDMRVNAREEARVISITDDDQGIPHVRFEKTLICSSKKDPQGIRLLALDAFAKDFHVA
ncbi:MAG: hypothetical protein JJ879_03040 [Sneathiella sp.]|nr:hypothetical protein [Sneathiella sp.]